MYAVIMPKAGQTMQEGVIRRWLKQEGDPIAVGEAIVEIETDKAIAEVPSEKSGLLRKILVTEGETVPVLATLAYVGGADEEMPADPLKRQPERLAAPLTPADAATPTAGVAEKRAVLVSPRAKKLASEHGLDITLIARAGPEGRVTEDDVRRYLDDRRAPTTGVDSAVYRGRGSQASGDAPEAAASQSGRPAVARLKWMYGRMTLLREFDERVQKLFLQGRITGAIHLYCGEEAVAVGVCASLDATDYVTSTHRGHGHCLAKGLDPRTMMAELYGKATGICKGKGGSMHMASPELGMLGANGIVAAGLPIACGAALSAKVRSTDQVAVAFLGDGASNAGAFHESLNLAAVLKLPVVFVVENNGFADTTRISYAAAIKNLAQRAAGYGIDGVTVDGNDVFAVAEAAKEVIARARADKLPSLLECTTHRYYGHYVGDTGSYRSEREVQDYRKNDCLLGFEKRVLDEGWLNQEELDRIKDESTKLVEEAVAFAESSSDPEPKDCLSDVYVSF
jgi:pyruvate dehydrogenase E1 component alpha subunit